MPEGIGLGLRSPLAAELFAEGNAPKALAWLEVHPENYLERGGHYETLLARARASYPLLTHGLTLGFGQVGRFDARFLRTLRAFLADLRVPFHSDHLCFAAVDGVFAHDLLPLPFHAEAVSVCVDRIHEAQDALGLPIAVEHISYYVTPPGSVMRELDHLNEVLSRADAKLLLDVNNVYVNAMNHGFDARAFIDELPLERVVQMHVAGHYVREDGSRIDTHAEPVCEEVYSLFEYALQRLRRPLPVLLERDDNFPPFAELCSEIERLDEIYRRVLSSAQGPRQTGRDPRQEAS
ncbi:MAG TPA: DUF692 domain-containing protein [Polyangiales bacterium]